MKKKKIGLIDLYIDEWHACNYPRLIAESCFGAEFEVSFAWEEAPAPGKRPLDAWCREYGVKACASIEETVEKSDALFILSPTFPEHHERLAERALQSGKGVFIDKPFCDTAAGTQRIFDLADRCRTPVTGFSALRFTPGLLAELERWRTAPPRFAAARGGGEIRGFLNYGIHLVTMLQMCMGNGAQRVMQHFGRGSEADLMVIEYPDGRLAELVRTPRLDFELFGLAEEEFHVRNFDGFFEKSIEEILRFFLTGESPVKREDILETIRIYEAGVAALDRPGEWVMLSGEGCMLRNSL